MKNDESVISEASFVGVWFPIGLFINLLLAKIFKYPHYCRHLPKIGSLKPETTLKLEGENISIACWKTKIKVISTVNQGKGKYRKESIDAVTI